MNEWECEKCGADMRSRYDPDGVGNYMGGEHGWVCNHCAREIEMEERDGQDDTSDLNGHSDR